MPKKINPNWATSRHSKTKMQNISDKERILKAERGKKPVIQKGTPVKINKLILQQKLWNQRKWHGVFKVLKGKITKTKNGNQKYFVQSIYHLGLMLKLKLQYFGCLMWRDDSLEKTLILGKVGSRRRRGIQKITWLNGIINVMTRDWGNSGRWLRTGKPDPWLLCYTPWDHKASDTTDWLKNKNVWIYNYTSMSTYRSSLMAQSVKNSPAMWETWAWSLDWGDPLEEGMAIQFNILDWRILKDRGAWRTAVHGVAKSWTQLSTCLYIVIYEVHGNQNLS